MQGSWKFVIFVDFEKATKMAKDYIELLELQQRIKEGIQDAFPDRLWVKAEIGQWSPRSNGHCYLSLTQSRGGKVVAESRAMIWKWVYPRLKAFFEEATGRTLEAGIAVLVRVEVNYSELYGISLFIDDIDPAFTLGEAALERKKAIEKLTVGGYMEMQKELSLPALPYRLAVISSATAAGYGDFRRHLLENEAGYVFEVDLFEALMQGESAPASIISAIVDVTERGGYDALLILRGGGSDLDLACFDDYDLAVAIATCPVPVITAIGHDRDYHIADMVASRFVKTPTALADLFLEAYADEDAALDALAGRVLQAALRRISAVELRLQALDARVSKAVQAKLAAMDRRVDLLQGRISRGLERLRSEAVRGYDHALHRLRFAAESRLGREVSNLALREAMIGASDPRKILSLGYVLVTGADNRVLKRVRGTAVGDRIGVRFSDGALLARVDKVMAENIDNKNIA